MAEPILRHDITTLLERSMAEMITIHCHGQLNDFLPRARRHQPIQVVHTGYETAKHVIEVIGVPHPEVEALLANGAPVDFGYRVSAGDQIEAYPVGDAPPATPLRPPLTDRRFVLDVHLGRLAAYLRMLGVDTLYSNSGDDPDLARIAGTEGRILLTRDVGLLKRSAVIYGAFIRAIDPELQLREVVDRFQLQQSVATFQRCITCNGRTEPVEKAQILDQLQPKTRRYYDAFWQCRECGQIYWHGSHVAHMQSVIDRVLGRQSPEAGDTVDI
jgi:uncharacterized protein with PIN domain